MASFGHLAVGAALGRATGARSPKIVAAVTGTFAGLAMLPDIDVAGVWLGLPDRSMWGHRGWSHSLLFALATALVVFLVARAAKMRALPWAVLAFAAVASHGFLDALTYDSRGVPLLWPIVNDRFTFSWRPIPPAPTGLRFLSARGIAGFFVEALYFAPFLVYVVVPVRRRRAAVRSTQRALAHSALVAASTFLCLALADLALRDWGPVARLDPPHVRSARP